jgi:hypothetical protein
MCQRPINRNSPSLGQRSLEHVPRIQRLSTQDANLPRRHR